MVKNTTRNKVLVRDYTSVNSVLGKTLGLMFKSKTDKGMLFNFNIENIHHIHTFFMRFSIDILFLDSSKIVTKIYKNAKPWRIHIHGKGKHVLELPSGKSFNTQIGDKISFK